MKMRVERMPRNLIMACFMDLSSKSSNRRNGPTKKKSSSKFKYTRTSISTSKVRAATAKKVTVASKAIGDDIAKYFNVDGSPETLTGCGVSTC